MIDGGAVIGQSAGARGSVIVNGGEWTNNGLLTVGDAGMGSLPINGMNRGITGQVTAWNATIGNQATGQGTVTLDGGELLVANVFSPSSTLVVGNLGNGSLVLENGSEVAVGAAQGQARQQHRHADRRRRQGPAPGWSASAPTARCWSMAMP